MKAEKTCSKCGETKPVTDFYRDRARKDGLNVQCKKCRKVYQQSGNGRAAQHKYRTSANAIVIHNRWVKIFSASGKGKAKRRQWMLRYIAKHPDRYHARAAVGTEILAGRMPPSSTRLCSCKNPADQYHHHNGYAKEQWLDVIPTCRKCHSKLDRVA